MLKNYALCTFSKVIKKWKVMKNPKTSNRAFFKNAQSDVFRFFNFQFFNHFWKNTQDIVFSTKFIFAYWPPSATNRDQNITFDHFFFCGKTCCFCKTITYFFLKKYHQFWVMTNKVTFSTTTKSTFLGKCHCTNFFRANCKFAPKTKTKKKWGLVLSESWRPNDFRTPWTYTMTKRIWGRNDFANLDNAVLLLPKNALFDPLLDI